MPDPANDLTGLVPHIHAGLNIVSRELIGFIPAVARNSEAERAAVNQSVKYPIVPAAALIDLTPTMEPPTPTGQAIAYGEMMITNQKAYPIAWSGEETRSLENAGSMDDVMTQQFAQGFRTIANAIEADLANVYKYASRAVGTAGTAPFGTANDLSDAANAMQILEDNGTPPGDLHLVVGSAAMANIRGKQSVLFKANEAGTDELLRRGTIGELEGFRLHNSAQVKLHTKGTAASYLTDLLAGYAVGDTSIHLDTGTGTHLAGDVVTFAGDSNKYVIGTGAAGDSDKDIVLGSPGLRAALADGVAATTGSSYRANVFFHRRAIQLVTRIPAMPRGGDAAVDNYIVKDEVSGLVFEVALYKGHLMNSIYIRLCWGWEPVKPDFIGILMG
jgi:hypothetical protein